jgi:predicted DCC family thiol-disulfide oxidoreductase YuxK
MKTLKNHTILYDADCPLCRAYTSAFIKTEMLDEKGRVPFQITGGEFCPGLNSSRAKNEIALLNRENGEVTYGIDSLIKILGNRFKFIEVIFRFGPLKFIFKRIYSFISYNRKVIVPAKANSKADFECIPDFRLDYRIAYLLFTWLVSSFILLNYSKLLTGIIPPSSFHREFFICGGQIIFQFISVGLLNKNKVADYLGNMMTISFAGSLLLLPAMILGTVTSIFPPLFFAGYFMLVVAFMLLEHFRRMKILELGWWPSVSWVLYRVIVLSVLIFIK